MTAHRASEVSFFENQTIPSYVFPILAVLVTYSYIYTGGQLIPDSLLFRNTHLAFYVFAYVFIGMHVLKIPKHTLSRRFSIFCLFVAGLGLYQAISLIWTPSFDYGFSKSARLMFITSLILGVSILSVTNKKRLNIILHLLIGTGASISIAVIVGGQLGYSPSDVVGASTYLKTSRPIGIALPIVVYYYVSKNNIYHKFLYACIGFVVLSGLLVTGSRGPLIAAILSAVIVLLPMLVIRRRSIINSLEYHTAFVLFLLFAAASILAYQFFGDGRTVSRLRPILTGDLDYSANVRLSWYPAAVRFWLDAPITGHGIGSFEYLSFGDKSVAGHRYPHNVFLEVLVELGAVGAALFIGLILTPLKGLYHSVTHDEVSIVVVAVLAYGIINSSLSFDLQSNRILYLCIGVSCWLIFQHYKPQS